MTAVPHPRSEAAEAAEAFEASEASGPDRSGRRSLALALLFGALGAAVVLLASRQGWSEGTATVAGGDFPLSARGSDVTGLPASLAIVGLAALVAVFAVRRAGRFLVAGLLALSGAGTVVSALLAVFDSSALDEKAAQASGDTAAGADTMAHTAWPYVAAAGGLLLLLAGFLALRHGRLWPSVSGRYERDGVTRPRRTRAPADPDRPEEIWKALDRGEDPTGA